MTPHIDRLSRSVVDFMGLLQLFEQHDVKFVSVSEHFDTSTPMGRFALGIMIQVAQLEREVISDRIAQKMGAARALGRWQGGRPPLGLDVVDKKLVLNEPEAVVVRDIFRTYLRLGTIFGTLDELAARGIRNKAWSTKDGKPCGGSAFDANSLRSLLRNPLLASRMWAGAEIVDAPHPTVVPRDLFDQVQAALDAARTDRSRERRPSGALLAGIFRCARCGGGMVPHYSQKGGRRWSYYLCGLAKRRGTKACPGTRVPMGAIEASVVEQIRGIGKDPEVQRAVVAAAKAEATAGTAALAADVKRLDAVARRLRAEHDRLVEAVAAGGRDVPALVARLRAAAEAADGADAALRDARERLASLKARAIDEADLRAALEAFSVWEHLWPAERARVLRLLVERIDFDPDTETVELRLHPGGIRELAQRAEPGA